MTDIKKPSSSQEKVIHDYFDSLLHDDRVIKKEAIALAPIPSESTKPTDAEYKKYTHQVDLKKNIVSENASVKPEQKAKPEKVITKSIMGLDQLIAEIPVTQVKIKQDTPTKTDLNVHLKQDDLPVKTDAIIEPDIILNPSQQVNNETLSVSATGVPDWAETRFQCLLFNVSGLNLAVPLIKLNSVIPWNDSITITPNKTKWYLGLVQHLQYQIKIIDTALLVLPENRRHNLSDDSNGRLSHILLVDDFKWGLACSSIGEVIWLNKEEVKWRKNKTNKVWLSGTSLTHLCAIMDTEVFAKMLNKSTQ